MADDDDIDELKAKRLCHQCIGEEYLKIEVRRKGKRRQCSYCDRNVQSFTIEDIADRVETAFEQHFRRTSDQPTSWQQSLLSDRESDYEWEREGELVMWAIANVAEIPDQAAQDIQTVLGDKYSDFEFAAMGEETEFCSESYYEEKGSSDHVWQEEWSNFERSLKTEARFFSRSAAAHLTSIFNEIDKMRTIDGRPLVIDAGPQTALTAVFRARVFQSDEKLKEALCRPDHHLGSPPAVLAVAGRMNARGISVFYGATDPSVAVAEVRPPVGSQVAVARFGIVRPLRLLDLTALSAVVTEDGSVFDPGWAAKLERATFLRSLSQRITKPVMPDDEAFEYLPTQAIADFLATENEPVLDGVLFPSVQVAGVGLNVVLFHKAALVEAMEIPAGMEIDASTGSTSEDGWEVDYSVYEQLPPNESTKEKDEEGQCGLITFLDDAWCADDADSRDPALRIDLESIKVHVVRSVKFECNAYNVRRHRLEKGDTEF